MRHVNYLGRSSGYEWDKDVNGKEKQFCGTVRHVELVKCQKQTSL